MISRYKRFLEFLDSKLKKMFESQSPFIMCKRGCALCCKEGEYPMSELEYIYMMLKYDELDSKIKFRIDKNIEELINKPREQYYTCPFLIDNSCSVYESRSIICRTFGLIYFDKNGRKKVPFCIDRGQNYADVFDKESDKIVKVAPDGTEPLAFNVGREFLRNKNFEKEYNIFFGEDKTLYDWLREDKRA